MILSTITVGSNLEAWTPILIYLYLGGNLCIIVTYMHLPFLFLNIWRKKKDIIDSWILLLLSLFVFLSGLTFIINIVHLWWSPLTLYTLIYIITGIVSLFTTILLPQVVKKKLRLLSREQYHGMLNKLQSELTMKELAISEKNAIIAELELSVKRLERVKSKEEWLEQQHNVLQDLKSLLTGKEGHNG